MPKGIFDLWHFLTRQSWRWDLISLFFQPRKWRYLLFLLEQGIRSTGILHDIGNTTLVLRFFHAEIVQQLTNQQNQYITQQLEHLTQQVLEGQKQLDGEELEPVSFNINECLDECLALFALQPELQLCTLSITRNAHFRVTGSPVVLTQALINIVRNSAQALTKESHKEILIHVEKVGAHGKIVITDNGPGFPHKFSARIFQSTKKQGQGIGLWHSFSQLERYCHCSVTMTNTRNGGAQTDLYFWEIQ